MTEQEIQEWVNRLEHGKRKITPEMMENFEEKLMMALKELDRLSAHADLDEMSDDLT